ncbi:MAG: hypothetical protein ACYDHN_00155 [Solirubrobacteraceae bacterium]
MSRPTEAALQSFFDRAAGEHAGAMGRAGEVDRRLRFGDRLLRFRIAGEALAGTLLGAFGPRLCTDSGPVHATFSLWEQCETPEPIAVPWASADVGPRGLIDGPQDAGVLAVQEAGSEALTLWRSADRELLYRVPAASALPWWERAAPLRPALFWALSGQGRHLVHAGAVGDRERGGVLLAGAGGSGKTTVALAALAAGLSYVADDYLLLQATTAWSLFATAKLDAGHRMRFPELGAAARISPEPVQDEKSVLDVDRDALAESLEIRAVIVPRIAGGRTRLRRASAGEALLALAPSTAFQMPFDRGRVVGSLAALVRRVPAFALDVGDDPDALAPAVDRVLDSVAAVAATARLPQVATS